MNFPKSDKARLSQTLTYLETTTAVTAAVRTTVHKFAKSWAEMSFPENKGKFYKGVQSSLSMKSLDDVGEAETRKQRRAMVLLWYAMTNVDQVERARTMGEGEVGAAFLSTLRKAKAKADMDKGDSSGNQDIFDNHFRRAPGEFLRSNIVVIYGIKAASQPADNIGTYFFSYDSTKDRYVIEPHNKPGSCQVKAVSVPAIYWGDVPGRGQDPAGGDFTNVSGTELTGASTMVSTQFTGCTFCSKNEAGKVYAAHIAPTNKLSASEGQDVVSIDATTLAEQLGKGNFGATKGPATFNVYGRDFGKHTFGNGYLFPTGSSGSTSWMTVIGFQDKAGGWGIYTQSISKDHAGPVRVRKLFPAPAHIA